MSDEKDVSQRANSYRELAAHLNGLLDRDPLEAIRQARGIDLETADRANWMGLRAATLIDGGAAVRQLDAIQEGVSLLRELHREYPVPSVTYNLANGLLSAVGAPPPDSGWLDHQERTGAERSEIRACFGKVIRDFDAEPSLRTQAWTNLASQFSNSYRIGEAHDARLVALEIDPRNGVAAYAGACDLLWLYQQGGCSELTYTEAMMLAKIADRHKEQIAEYAGAQAAAQIANFVQDFEEPPTRTPHTDPFILWVEQERLTLAPAVELIDPSLGKLDWLMLPAILEREAGPTGGPPPIFAMFNVLKADFILARDLVWRAHDESTWPTTGRFSDTLDFAKYGPSSSAMVLAHRAALDLLDKVGVTANYYFELGQAPEKISFGNDVAGTSKE